ncbi:MAG TPA: ATP-binding cassette domain-containing protein [Candidatus Thermoplasmatota archaeon]|nr:ATP-binding cassette domain-containing protein [Candidatus Thermoplasmatota archaeon]
MDALRLEKVEVGYPGRPAILRGVDLRLGPGELLVVDGRSGSGKSTLLAVAAGLQPPTRGRVAVMGQEYDPRDPGQRAGVRARSVGLVFQHLHLLGELTVEENVMLPLRLAHVPAAAARARAHELLRPFGLEALARRRPAQLSGGEQQRTAIARALALRPGVLLVDEPTSNLDAQNAATVAAALQQAAGEGAAVLVASHDELMHRAGRRVRLREGVLEAPR